VLVTNGKAPARAKFEYKELNSSVQIKLRQPVLTDLVIIKLAGSSYCCTVEIY